MKNILTHYKAILSCDQFVVTGSFAMFLHGLIDEKNVSDLDIILVNPTPETKILLNKLQEAQPAKTQPGSGEVSAIFMHDNVKIDVFILDKPVTNTLIFEGIEVSPVGRIILAKQKYGRMKDWIHLRNMSRLFFKQEDFEKTLNSGGMK
jgi:hypothetical protein